MDLDSSNVHPELKGFKMMLRSDDPDSDECELNKDAALQVLMSVHVWSTRKSTSSSAY